MNIKNSSYTEILEIKDLCRPTRSGQSSLKNRLYSSWNHKNLAVQVDLKEIDTSTAKCLFDVFKLIGLKVESGANVNINWHYESSNKDMFEIGEDYSDLFELPFRFVEQETI
ncbi:MAG: SiaC family regulatory phosphoprotein [Cyclobacteriaceae bacterium]